MARMFSQYMGDPTRDEGEILSRLLASRQQTPPDAIPSEDAPLRFRAPELEQGAPPGGFTPPPPAATPEPMQRVGGRTPGIDDALMLAAILGSAALNKPQVSLQLAGAYGSGLMQDRARRDSRNQEVDNYNAQLQAKDPGLERWKAEQQARQAYDATQVAKGNLGARNKGLSLEEAKQQQLQKQYLDETDINSGANQTEIAKAKALAEARSGADIATAKGRADAELAARRAMGAEGLLFAPKSGAAGQPRTPKQEYEDQRYKLLGDLLGQGKIDPATQKAPTGTVDGVPEGVDPEDIDPATGQPYSAAQRRLRANDRELETPIPGAEVINPAAWKASVVTPGARDKIVTYFKGVQQVRNALGRMQDLRKKYGTEVMGQHRAAYDAAQLAAIGGFTQIGNSGVLNAGEFERYKALLPEMGPHLNDATRIFGGEDPTLAKLDGVAGEIEALAADGLATAGLRLAPRTKEDGADLNVAATTGEQGGPGMTFEKAQGAATSGGQRLYSITTPSGQKGQRELTEAQANQLRAKGFTVQ